MGTTTDRAQSPASPCIGVCKLDGGGVCQGCFRSKREIGEYGAASNERRRQINAQAETRRQQAQATR